MPGSYPAHSFSLLRHPDTASEAVRRITAFAERADAETLRLRYLLEGDLPRIRVPAPQRGGRGDRLWAHTCFEAFVATEDAPGYLELNFSPSGRWAAYRFEAYRAGMAPIEPLEPPVLSFEKSERQLELQAKLRIRFAGRWRLALSTVVEEGAGTLSYWALRHPPGRPDFHHPHSFSLALEFPRKALK